MKKLSLFLFSFVVFCGHSQDFSLLSSDENTSYLQHKLLDKGIATTTINALSHRDYGKSYRIVSSEKGAPALPFFTESVLLNNRGKVSLSIEHDGYVDYQNVLVAPSKGDLKRNVDPASVAYEFGTSYTQNAFYPSAIAELGDAYILRKTRGITVSIHPIQYNPVSKVLRVYKNIRVKVHTDEAQVGENELNVTGNRMDAFSSIYLSHYANGRDLLQRYTPKSESGDLLIVCDPDLMETMESFVRWKTQKGIKTSIVSTAVTGTTSSSIHAYISQQYTANSDLLYVILVGDHEQIPAYSYGTSGSEELWSDSYYGQLSGGSTDFYPELFVGRFSASTVDDLLPQVDRVLEYEKNPVSGTWMKNALGLGSNEGDGYGDDGESDYAHLRHLRTKLQAFGYETVHEFYQGSQGGADASGEPSGVGLNSAVNEGIGLFNYCGHGWTEGVSTGDYQNSHINQLTNFGKYPFVISVACNNGTFVGETCFSEAWLRAKKSTGTTGAIAAVGSSILMSWAPPMQTQDEITELISENYVNNRKSTIGGLFYNAQLSMLESYNSSSTAEEVMQTWVLFGDPTCLFRSKETANLTANHVAQIPQTTTSVLVNCNIEGALVAIVQDGVLLGTGTVNGGNVTITIGNLATDLPLVVTATKQNYSVYVGSIQVANGPLGIQHSEIESLRFYPNPVADFLHVDFVSQSENASVQLTDLNGKILLEQVEKSVGSQSIRLDVSSLKVGLYVLVVNDGDNRSIKKVTIF